MPELQEADALAMLRHEARLRNLSALAQAEDDQLRPIYRTVGGNPLALRLVLGQTLVHGLADILDDLTAAHGEAAESLYTYIYRRAWNNLGETERRTLLPCCPWYTKTQVKLGLSGSHSRPTIGPVAPNPQPFGRPQPGGQSGRPGRAPLCHPQLHPYLPARASLALGWMKPDP